MLSDQDLERLSKWVYDNLKIKPKSDGLLTAKKLIEATKQNVLKNSLIECQITEVMCIINQIKIGNTPKYQKLKDNVLTTLQNVLNEITPK